MRWEGHSGGQELVLDHVRRLLDELTGETVMGPSASVPARGSRVMVSQ